MKTIRIVLSPEAEEVYKYLNEESTYSKTERAILHVFHQKISLIKVNFHYGNPVAKNLIPNEYIAKYGVKNLFRVELPNYWRMLYTLTDGDSEIEIIAFI